MTESSVNVASHLARMAHEHPQQIALQIPRTAVRHVGDTLHHAITFAHLNKLCDALAHGLKNLGITPGSRCVLMVPPSLDFFSLTFALFKVGAVPVLIDPGMGIKNLGRCLAEAEPTAFIGIGKAHLARRILGWGNKTIRTTINVGTWKNFCTRSTDQILKEYHDQPAFEMPEVAGSDTAAILFTSGSTGIAKGAIYTHGIFAAQVEMLKETYGIMPGEVDFCTFPLFALFGPALGMTGIIPDMDARQPAKIDPRKAIAQVRQFGVTNFFGSPAVIRKLGEYRDTHPNEGTLPTIRRVISAGAPASPLALEQFQKWLEPGVEIFTPYGATEALPVANIGSAEILRETRTLTEQGHGVCIGRPVSGMCIEVIRISDEPISTWSDDLKIPTGDIGEFVVRGPVVTQAYLNRPEATHLAKIHDPQSGTILHRMGDVGYRDAQGRLWFCGRKSHRVVTATGTLFTDQIEPIFNQLPPIHRTALVGVRRGEIVHPVLCVELKKSFPDTIWKELLNLLAIHAKNQTATSPIQTFLKHPGFPMDVRHNSKIFREQLALWADRHLGSRWKGPTP